jgi:hypothetical protein
MSRTWELPLKAAFRLLYDTAIRARLDGSVCLSVGGSIPGIAGAVDFIAAVAAKKLTASILS